MTDIVEQLGPDEVLQEARELLRFYQASDPSKPYTCSVIADCISMIEALRAASEWRDISTAPRDGTEVLLWLGKPWSKAEKAKWYEPWSNWICGPVPYDPAREEYHGIGAALPTHWQPLPAPPQRNEVTK